MSGLVFPPNPVVGQTFTGPDGQVWRWDGVKWIGQGAPAAGGPFLPLAGGTMLGMLALAADPINGLEAATKDYVDDNAAGGGGPFLPLAGGTMAGPLNWTATGTTDSRSAQNRSAEIVNVLDFGAVGDGVTNDTAAFQAAIATGHTIHVPRGWYIVGPLVLGQAMFGAGMGATILQLAAGTAAGNRVITWNDAGPSTIRDLTIDGNDLAAIGIFTGTMPQRGLRIEDVEVRNGATSMQQGIFINWDEVDPASKRQVVITNCHIHDMLGQGINIGGQGHVIAHNTIQNCGHSGIGCWGATVDSVIANNTIRDIGWNLLASSDGIVGYGDGNLRVLVIGNTIANGVNHGIHMGGSNIQIIGNKIFNITNGHGIMLQSGPVVATQRTNGLIADNEVDTVAANAGIRVSFTDRVVVSGNTVYNAGLLTAGTPGAISFMDCIDSVCSNNLINNSAGHGVYTYGAGGLIIDGNQISNVAGSGIFDLGGSPGIMAFGNRITGEGTPTVPALAGTAPPWAPLGALSGYLPISGGTLSGPLVVPQGVFVRTGAVPFGLLQSTAPLSWDLQFEGPNYALSYDPPLGQVNFNLNGTALSVGPTAIEANVDFTANGRLLLTRDPTAPLEAATRRYVDALVASLSLFISTWKVAANTPDISDTSGNTRGDYYIATTVNPNVAETAPAGIPGIGGMSVNNGDMVIWDENTSVYQLVRGSPLTVAEADAFYVQKSGDVMTGPLTLAANPAGPLQAATKQYVDDFLPLTGGTVNGPFTVTPPAGPWGYQLMTVGSPALSTPGIWFLSNQAGGTAWGLYRYGGNLWITRGTPTIEGEAFVNLAPTGIGLLQNVSITAGMTTTLGGNATTGLQATTFQQMNAADNLRLLLTGGTLTGNLTVSPPTGWTAFIMNTSAGNANLIRGNMANSTRWELYLGDGATESGGNAGNNLVIGRHSDAGASLGNAVSIIRQTGEVRLPLVLISGGTIGTTASPVGQVNSSSQITVASDPFARYFTQTTTPTNQRWSFGGRSSDGSFVLVDETAVAYRMLVSPAGVVSFAAGTTVFVSGDPTFPLEVATKRYVDALGVGPFLPLTGGTVSGPVNTTMPAGQQMNNLISTDVGLTRSTLIYSGPPTTANQRWRWIWAVGGAESGANTGADFALQAYDDTGGTIPGNPVEITRATGMVRLRGASLGHAGQPVGFYGATPQTRQTITGTRIDPQAALANLLNVLSTNGLIIDNTTPGVSTVLFQETPGGNTMLTPDGRVIVLAQLMVPPGNWEVGGWAIIAANASQANMPLEVLAAVCTDVTNATDIWDSAVVNTGVWQSSVVAQNYGFSPGWGSPLGSGIFNTDVPRTLYVAMVATISVPTPGLAYGSMTLRRLSGYDPSSPVPASQSRRLLVH